MDDMVNISKLLINTVSAQQAKGADRLGPKGKGIGMEGWLFSIADVTSPGKEAEPTHPCYSNGTR